MKSLTLAAVAVLLGATATLANDAATRTTTLTGAEEVPAGDPDGTGTAAIEIRPKEGKICWKVTFDKIAAPSAAHIHKAPAGANGGAVLPLKPVAGGCSKAKTELIKALLEDPNGYYVNVHTPDFPEGAIRGQMSNGGQNY